MFEKIGILLVVLFWIWGWIIFWPISKIKAGTVLKGLLSAIVLNLIVTSVFLAVSNIGSPHDSLVGLLSIVAKLGWKGWTTIVGGIFAAVLFFVYSSNEDKRLNDKHRMDTLAYCVIFAFIEFLGCVTGLLIVAMIGTFLPEILLSVFH
jgi:hypothetical protein